MEACIVGCGGDSHPGGAPPGGSAGTMSSSGEGGSSAGTAGALAGTTGLGGAAGTGGTIQPSGTGGTGGPSDPTGVAGTMGIAGSGGRGGTSAAAGSTGAGARGGTGGGAGASGTGGSGAAAGSGDPAGYVPALIGVGYGGIRIVSRDGGKTWGDRAYATTSGGDDEELLRAVAYGKGLWIATGWKLVTSTDGVNWTDRGLIKDGNKVPGCTIVEGLAYNAGYFFAACTPWDAPGTVFRSSDGLSWTKYGTIGDTGGHLFMTYRGGKFVAYGDSGTSYQSNDGLTWSVLSGIDKATYCQDTFKTEAECKDSSWFDGAWLRADWQGIISRSTDGKSFSKVYTDDKKNTLYQSRAIAAGLVAPR